MMGVGLVYIMLHYVLMDCVVSVHFMLREWFLRCYSLTMIL